jgi:hypothetical protein
VKDQRNRGRKGDKKDTKQDNKQNKPNRQRTNSMPAHGGSEYRDHGRDRYRDDYDNRGRRERVTNRAGSRAPSLVVCQTSS